MKFKPNCECVYAKVKLLKDKHTDEPQIVCARCGVAYLKVIDQTDALNEAMALSMTWDGIP